MDLQDALKRIEELERRVRDLEARPVIQHHHYHTYPPNYVGPVPYVPPQPPLPAPFPPWIVCGPGNNLKGGAFSWAGGANAGGCAPAPVGGVSLNLTAAAAPSVMPLITGIGAGSTH